MSHRAKVEATDKGSRSRTLSLTRSRKLPNLLSTAVIWCRNDRVLAFPGFVEPPNYQDNTQFHKDVTSIHQSLNGWALFLDGPTLGQANSNVCGCLGPGCIGQLRISPRSFIEWKQIETKLVYPSITLTKSNRSSTIRNIDNRPGTGSSLLSISENGTRSFPMGHEYGHECVWELTIDAWPEKGCRQFLFLLGRKLKSKYWRCFLMMYRLGA